MDKNLPKSESRGYLSSLPSGRYRCLAVERDGHSETRLKQLGICEGREFVVLLAGDPMILFVSGAQIAISRAVAQSVLVSASKTDLD